jgi:hypothetical protein
MATSTLLTATNQNILKAARNIGSNLAYDVRANLPPVGDGTGLTIDNNVLLTVAANSTGGIELLDSFGRRVWFVRPRTAVILRSTDMPDAAGPPRWVMERPGTVEAAHIADLAGTNLVAATTASAAAFNAAYTEAQSDTDINTYVDVVGSEITTLANATLVEIEDKLNAMLGALMISLGATIDKSPNAGTSEAIAATPWPAVAEVLEDDDKIATSANAFNVKVRLPVVSDGTGTTVDDGYTMRFEANAAGGIYVEDNYGRLVGFVPPYSNATVQSSDDPNRPWQFILDGGFEIPLGRSAFGGFFRFTRMTATASAADSPASYTDAGWNSAVDAAVDAVLDGFDAGADAAFNEVDAFLAALLLTLEGLDVLAES